MNRTIKDATLKVFHYPDLDSLKAHVLAFVRTYNFAKAPEGLALEDALRGHQPSRIHRARLFDLFEVALVDRTRRVALIEGVYLVLATAVLRHPRNVVSARRYPLSGK
jgi:hypothetical protein